MPTTFINPKRAGEPPTAKMEYRKASPRRRAVLKEAVERAKALAEFCMDNGIGGFSTVKGINPRGVEGRITFSRILRREEKREKDTSGF